MHNKTLAQILLKGGVVGAIWGHHLYFLACNAYSQKAVWRMNKIKGRPQAQVFASPGAVEEAEEFADFQKCKALAFAAKKMKMTPRDYIASLYKKFPITLELFAKDNIPSSVTFAKEHGKTIWIAGHMADRSYSKLLETVRKLRGQGRKIIFAGTSLNIRGNKTLTVREFDKVVEYFGRKLEAISVHPRASSLKKLRYSVSSSVISFIDKRPVLKRLGSTNIDTLKKYVPGLLIPPKISSTRR